MPNTVMPAATQIRASIAGLPEKSGPSLDELYRHSRRVAVWAIVIASGLGICKLVGGWLGHSVALMSDGIQSLGGAVAHSAVLVALGWAQRPPNPDHPYGYSRLEAVVGSSVACVLVLSAIAVGWQALATLSEPSSVPATYTLWIAGATIVINEGFYHYAAHSAQRTGSRAIWSSAWDLRLDALSALAALVGVALTKWAGWHAADHFAAVVVGAVMLFTGCHLYWESLQELTDQQADAQIIAAVQEEAQAVPGVQGIEKLFIRKAGLEYLADIHVEVAGELTVRQGHELAHAVKDRLLDRFVTIQDVLVHIEPAPGDME